MTEAMRQSKRYEAARHRLGNCFACVHRQQTAGAWHCQNTPARKYPDCETDNGVGRFTFDASVMAQFLDRGRGNG